MGMTAEEHNYIQALKDRQIKLEHFMRTDGWKLFDEMLQSAEVSAEQASAQANDAWNGAKHHGAYHAVRFIRTWIARETAVIRQQIQGVLDAAEARDRYHMGG